jgi:hypothetical protein
MGPHDARKHPKLRDGIPPEDILASNKIDSTKRCGIIEAPPIRTLQSKP